MAEARLDPRAAPATWGEFLRVRGTIQELAGHHASAHHDFAQSTAVFDLLGERYQAALSRLALGRLAATTGARQQAERWLDDAEQAFLALGAEWNLNEVATAKSLLPTAQGPSPAVSPSDNDEAVIRRLVDAAILPVLLARETATALHEALHAKAAVVYVTATSGDVKVLAAAGVKSEESIALATAAARGDSQASGHSLIVETLGRGPDGERHGVAVISAGSVSDEQRRMRLLSMVARQGFDLCDARQTPTRPADQPHERSLEPLLPGFICASAAMNKLAEQVQRLQGHDLTVLITGESGTGKDLVARAIHSGSTRKSAMFLPFNCTTTTRELADSQLFGHRRGSFTGAITDQQGLIRSAAGGTLFLDEIGDLPLDIQPKLLRFLEQSEIMPVGETRPQSVDVRVLAATNADLEQRVAEGRFREDLYYRLSVIRLVVPPLRDRREEIPHLSTYFLRQAGEQLSKADIQLGQDTLDLFAGYWWPGNIRQLKNEIQRAVAMSPAGGTIRPEHLSADFGAPDPRATGGSTGAPFRPVAPGNLATAVEVLERQVIAATLHRTGGNISEAARILGLTRRGLYLKLKRLGLDQVPADTQ